MSHEPPLSVESNAAVYFVSLRSLFDGLLVDVGVGFELGVRLDGVRRRRRRFEPLDIMRSLILWNESVF